MTGASSALAPDKSVNEIIETARSDATRIAISLLLLICISFFSPKFYLAFGRSRETAPSPLAKHSTVFVINNLWVVAQTEAKSVENALKTYQKQLVCF